MPPDHPGLSAPEVLARGGWHPRYARVLAVASDGDYGFAVVDGNGDGAELDTEIWRWDGTRWASAGSAGAGPLSTLGPVRTGGQIEDAYFAYGHAAGRRSITIGFDGRRYTIPVARHGVWAFIKIRTNPHGDGFPGPVGAPGEGLPPAKLET